MKRHDFEFTLDNFLVTDKVHSFLKEVGVKDFYIKMKEGQKLRFILPIEIESNTYTNETIFHVKNIESNIGNIDLNLGWEKLIHPRIQIRVNNFVYEYFLRYLHIQLFFLE